MQVTNPSVWVVLAACVALLTGLLSWGVFGTVSTDVTSTGVVVGNRTMCFLSAEDVAYVHVGDDAVMGGAALEVSEVSVERGSRKRPSFNQDGPG